MMNSSLLRFSNFKFATSALCTFFLLTAWMTPILFAEEAVAVEAESVEAVAAESETEQNLQVLRVDVRGNQVVNTSTILGNLKTQRGMQLSQGVINEDIKRLYATGFFQDIRIDVEDAEDGVQVVVVVDEKPIIRRIDVSGNEVFNERDIRKQLELIEGQVLNEFAVKQGVNKIKEKYADKGFRFVHVKYRVDTDRRTKEATVHIIIQEGAKYKIADVVFEGVKSLPIKKVKKLLKTKSKNLWMLRFGTFKDQKFQDDLDRMVGYYQWNGFLDARVTHDFEYDDEQGRMMIKIQVDEGRQYRANVVDLQGIKVLPENEVWQLLTMLPGDIYSQQLLAEEAQAIRDFYYNYGYMGVDVLPDVKVNNQTGKVDVVYQIKEGDPFFVDKVKIRGNTKTKDIVIRRELRIQPGEKFDGVALKKSKQRLNNLGIFEKVSYETEPGSGPNRKNIIFRIEEKRTGELSFGAGVSSIDQFIGFGEIAQRNFDLLNWPRFTGAGQRISLRARWGTITRNFDFSFVEPYIFNKPISFGFDVFNLRRENRNVDFVEDRLGFGTTFSKAFSDFLRVGAGYKFEQVDLSDIENDASPDVKLFEGENWLSRLKLFMTHDTRDNIFNPTKGWQAGLSGELIGTVLGGEQDYYILQGNFTKYWSFDEGNHVIEWRTRLGFADELGSDQVPVFDRFFAGGFGTVRGYNFRRVGPIEGGSAIGGSSMVLVNLEYTFQLPYIEMIKGAFFIDLGDVEHDAYSIAFDEFRVSVGPGLKINTPIGPVAFYYGFPIVNRDTEDKNGRFEFSLSRGF
jgi:outer membrane protein insertion porin family